MNKESLICQYKILIIKLNLYTSEYDAKKTIACGDGILTLTCLFFLPLSKSTKSINK